VKIPRLKGIWLMMPAVWASLAAPHLHNNLPLTIAYATGVGVMVPWILWSVLTVDPEIKRQQQLEASRQKTLELEKELGYEPLNLHELDDILKEARKEES
jgi:hypothetical protein